MKHVIDLIEFPNNNEVYNFSINNPSVIIADFNRNGLFPRIVLPMSEIRKYVNENKIYYGHTYNSTDNITVRDVYVMLFVYCNEDKSFHIGICQSSLFNTDKNIVLELIDLTERLKDSNEFWIPKYCSYNYEKFHTYQTTLTSLFDSEAEAVIDEYEDNIKKFTYKLAEEKATYVTLSNEKLFESEFNKILKERIEQLKEDIKAELNAKKVISQEKVNQYSEKVTYITEQMNNYKNGTNNI